MSVSQLDWFEIFGVPSMVFLDASSCWNHQPNLNRVSRNVKYLSSIALVADYSVQCTVYALRVLIAYVWWMDGEPILFIEYIIAVNCTLYTYIHLWAHLRTRITVNNTQINFQFQSVEQHHFNWTFRFGLFQHLNKLWGTYSQNVNNSSFYNFSDPLRDFNY